MGANHTPEPWKREGRYVVAEVPSGRPGGEVIAVFGPTCDRLRGKIPDSANAQLACAAPKLLRACRKVLEILYSCEGEDSLKKGTFIQADIATNHLLHEAQEMCAVAVAEAEGR